MAFMVAGAGELLLTSVERDGTMKGYDLALIQAVAEAVPIPLIAAGEAGKEDVFEGSYAGRTRGVIVPRNKRSISQGTLNSIWRQAGVNREIKRNCVQIWNKHWV